MKVGILGPISTKELSPLLEGDLKDLPSGNGGYPVTLLVDELVRAGHEVRVWTLDPGVQRPEEAAGEGLRITYLPYRSGRRARDAYREERRWLGQAMADEAVDVMNAHWSYEFALAAMTRDDPLVLTVHDWAPAILRYQTDMYRVVRLGMYAVVHSRRPAMTTPSPYVRDKLSRLRLGTPAVVPNGVVDSIFVDRARSRGSGFEILGISMGFSRRKNTTSLLRAHAQLRAAGMPSNLTLIGAAHGPGEAAEAWARANGVADHVTFRGLVEYDEALAALGSTDLFIHPALEESFGMVLTEAMAQATPVIGGIDSGAVGWVLGDGKAGRLVDVTDPSAISNAAHQILSDRTVWEAMSGAGLQHCRDHFSMTTVRDGYLAAYDRVLGNTI